MNELFTASDANGDGLLDFDEYKNFVIGFQASMRERHGDTIPDQTEEEMA